jgi:hypothetical protein
MRHGSWAPGLGSVVLLATQAVAAQQPPKPKDLPEAPAPTQGAPSRKRLQATFEILPEYGQGMAGYGKRFGSSMASGASTEFFSTFLFASLFHRDPRYFVSLRGGPWHRIGYGVSRVVVARTDPKREGLNWPGILGPLFAESLANSYLPVTQQTAGQTFLRYGVRLGFTAGSNGSKSIGRRSSGACASPRSLRALARSPLLPSHRRDHVFALMRPATS